MLMKKTILIVLLLFWAGSMTCFAGVKTVYENDYENLSADDAISGWNWGDGATTHAIAYIDYDGNTVVEHAGTINNSAGTGDSNCRFGSKWDLALSGNTSTEPTDYTIEFDLRSVFGNWDPINLEFFFLIYNSSVGSGTYGYGSGASPYAQADDWVHIEANLADLTAGWWEGTDWDLTNPTWSIEVGGPPYPGAAIPAGTPAWDQIWLMDNLKITMISEQTEIASKPFPDDEATDVFYEPSLSWTPGEYADTHNVYFGTDVVLFDDIRLYKSALSVTD
jgi:hypothetical protein